MKKKLGLLLALLVAAGVGWRAPVAEAETQQQVNVTQKVSDLPSFGAPVLSENTTNGNQVNFTSQYHNVDNYVIYICDANILQGGNCIGESSPGYVAKVTGNFSYSGPQSTQDIKNSINLNDGDYAAQMVVTDYYGRKANSNKVSFSIRTQTPDFTAVSESAFDVSGKCALNARLSGNFKLPSCFNIAMENLVTGQTTLIQRCFASGNSWSTVIGLGATGSYRFRIQAVNANTQTNSAWSAWKTLIVDKCSEPTAPVAPPPPPPAVAGPTIGGSTGGFLCMEIFIGAKGGTVGSEYEGYRLLKCFCGDEIVNDNWSLNYELPDGDYEVVMRGVTESGTPLSEWSQEVELAGTGGDMAATSGLTAPGFSLLVWLASLSQDGYRHLEIAAFIIGVGILLWLLWLWWYNSHMLVVVDYAAWKETGKLKKARAEGAMVRFIDADGKIAYQRITDKKGRVYAKLKKGDYVATVNWRFYRLMELKNLDVADREKNKFLMADKALHLKGDKTLTGYLPIAAQPLTDSQ